MQQVYNTCSNKYHIHGFKLYIQTNAYKTILNLKYVTAIIIQKKKIIIWHTYNGSVHDNYFLFIICFWAAFLFIYLKSTKCGSKYEWIYLIIKNA